MLMTFMMTIDVCTFIFIFRLRVYEYVYVCVWMDGPLRTSVCVCVYYCFCSLYLLHHLMCVGINVGLFDRNTAICQEIPKNVLVENWAHWTRTMNYAHSNVHLHSRFFHTFIFFLAEWICGKHIRNDDTI